jgi:hypothetical protein
VAREWSGTDQYFCTPGTHCPPGLLGNDCEGMPSSTALPPPPSQLRTASLYRSPHHDLCSAPVVLRSAARASHWTQPSPAVILRPTPPSRAPCWRSGHDASHPSPPHSSSRSPNLLLLPRLPISHTLPLIPHTPMTMNRRASTSTTLCGQLVHTFFRLVPNVPHPLRPFISFSPIGTCSYSTSSRDPHK